MKVWQKSQLSNNMVELVVGWVKVGEIDRVTWKKWQTDEKRKERESDLFSGSCFFTYISLHGGWMGGTSWRLNVDFRGKLSQLGPSFHHLGSRNWGHVPSPTTSSLRHGSEALEPQAFQFYLLVYLFIYFFLSTLASKWGRVRRSWQILQKHIDSQSLRQFAPKHPANHRDTWMSASGRLCFFCSPFLMQNNDSNGVIHES